jgi:hypothetical protein
MGVTDFADAHHPGQAKDDQRPRNPTFCAGLYSCGVEPAIPKTSDEVKKPQAPNQSTLPLAGSLGETAWMNRD